MKLSKLRRNKIKIQVKAPYTALSRSGLKLHFGAPKEVSPDDPRVVFWLENGYAEIVEPKKARKEKEL